MSRQSTKIERVCEHCQKSFLGDAQKAKAGAARFCSRSCYALGRKRRPMSVRFWKHVDRNGPIPPHRPELGPCWIWTGCSDRAGYGTLVRDHTHKKIVATHASWEIHFSPVPDGLWVLHQCDNPRCVNPDHLFLGTHADNMADMRHKGRGGYKRRPGESNPIAKLTEDAVRSIRAEYAAGSVTKTALAAKYGVRVGTICFVLLRQTWQHI